MKQPHECPLVLLQDTIDFFFKLAFEIHCRYFSEEFFSVTDLLLVNFKVLVANFHNSP